LVHIAEGATDPEHPLGRLQYLQDLVATLIGREDDGAEEDGGLVEQVPGPSACKIAASTRCSVLARREGSAQAPSRSALNADTGLLVPASPIAINRTPRLAPQGRCSWCRAAMGLASPAPASRYRLRTGPITLCRVVRLAHLVICVRGTGTGPTPRSSLAGFCFCFGTPARLAPPIACKQRPRARPLGRPLCHG
jgi:hypothetical protein